MLLTKIGHSCVRLEKDGARLLIDPGIWSGPDPLAGASAILITHEHVDHLAADVVRSALERQPDLELWSTAPVAERFADFDGRAHAVADGDEFTAAGFEVRAHGWEHAAILPGMPVVPNVGFLIDANVFHPGDAFTVPPEPVRTLLLPISAPWLKASEAFGYAGAVAPQVCYGIHDEVLNENGRGLIHQLGTAALGDGAGRLIRLDPGTSTEV